MASHPPCGKIDSLLAFQKPPILSSFEICITPFWEWTRTGSCQAFLDSEPNHRDPKNLGVVITVEGRPKFAEAGIDDPTAHFTGKTIRVRGVVIRNEKGPYIEVNDPSQIEMVN